MSSRVPGLHKVHTATKGRLAQAERVRGQGSECLLRGGVHRQSIAFIGSHNRLLGVPFRF